MTRRVELADRQSDIQRRWADLRSDVVRALGLIVERLAEAGPDDPLPDLAARFARVALALIDDHQMDRDGKCRNRGCACWWGLVRRVCPTLRVVRHHLTTDRGLYVSDVLTELAGKNAGLAATHEWLRIGQRLTADAGTQPLPAILDHDGSAYHAIPAQPSTPHAFARG